MAQPCGTPPGSYVKYKTLQKQLEFFDIQEEYIKGKHLAPPSHDSVMPHTMYTRGDHEHTHPPTPTTMRR